jgi:hypothetical protein
MEDDGLAAIHGGGGGWRLPVLLPFKAVVAKVREVNAWMGHLALNQLETHPGVIEKVPQGMYHPLRVSCPTKGREKFPTVEARKEKYH